MCALRMVRRESNDVHSLILQVQARATWCQALGMLGMGHRPCLHGFPSPGWGQQSKAPEGIVRGEVGSI